MAGDPPDIGRAPIDVLIANVEDILGGRINAHQVAASGVQDSLRLSRRSAGVKEVKRMLAVERRRQALCIHVFQFPMPPDVAAFFHVNFISGPPKNDHAPDRRALAERVIDIFLQWHNSAPAIRAVRSDDRDGAAINNTITNALGAEPTEDHRMHRADPRAGQHGNRGLGNIWQINDDPISFFDVVSFQHVCETANFAMQLLVSEGAFVAWFAFPNNRRLVPPKAFGT